MLITVGLGRYMYARAEMYKSADGAALAAVQEVDVQAYRERREIVLLPSAYALAQEYAAYNSDYLQSRGIVPHVTAIEVDQASDTVRVKLEADASSLFPKFFGGMTVKGEGTAQVRFCGSLGGAGECSSVLNES